MYAAKTKQWAGCLKTIGCVLIGVKYEIGLGNGCPVLTLIESLISLFDLVRYLFTFVQWE